MGCSSSTQTHTQGSNKPPAKSVETNGPKKSASSDVSDQIVDDIETIPDQTKLVPEQEASTNDPPTEEEQVEATEAVELEASEGQLPAEEVCEPSGGPADDEEPEEPEPCAEVQENHDLACVEGEIEDAAEDTVHEEPACEEGETMEEETGHSADAAGPEISETNIEE